MVREKQMNTALTKQIATRNGSAEARAERRLKDLDIDLPAPPEPFGIYAETAQSGSLLFLTALSAIDSEARVLSRRVVRATVRQ
jgi:hypothetical protein